MRVGTVAARRLLPLTASDPGGGRREARDPHLVRWLADERVPLHRGRGREHPACGRTLSSESEPMLAKTRESMRSAISIGFLLSMLKDLFRPTADPTAYRTRQLLRALFTSFGGRIVSTFVQLIAVPVAITALGTDRFGVYAVLAAILNWVNLSSVGIGPGLTVQIVSAQAANDLDSQTNAFSTAFIASLVLAGSVILGVQLLIALVGVDRLFGERLILYRSELEDGLRILSLIMAFTLVFGVAEAARPATKINISTVYG